MILIIVILSALVTRVSLQSLCNNTAISSNSNTSAPLNNADPAIQLYNCVTVGDYRTAVEISFNLDNDCKADVICSVVNRLLFEGKTNVVEYAYNLWYRFGESIVKMYFPIEFRLLFNEIPVMIINKENELAVRLAQNTDHAGDRGTQAVNSVNAKQPVPSGSWKISPIWENNKVYFKILNLHYNQYLKLKVKADFEGEHRAFGDNEEDTWRHEWYLHPVVYDNQILFYIYNRRYKHALKILTSLSDDDVEELWAHNGPVVGNPKVYGWRIELF